MTLVILLICVNPPSILQIQQFMVWTQTLEKRFGVSSLTELVLEVVKLYPVDLYMFLLEMDFCIYLKLTPAKLLPNVLLELVYTLKLQLALMVMEI